MALGYNGNQLRIVGVQSFGVAILNSCYPASLQSNFCMTNKLRNITAGEGITDDMVGLPMGNLHPKAWVMPQKPGMISSRGASLSITSAANGLRGMLAVGDATITIDCAPLVGQLIVSGEGSASLSITTNAPLMTASLSGEGSASLSLSATATADGIGNFPASTATINVAASAVMTGIGSMVGTTEEAGLTPSGIATAVWQRGIEAGYTAEEMLRILASVAAGSATGLEGANPQFMGIDGTTLRVDGAYSGGTRTIDSLNGS